MDHIAAGDLEQAWFDLPAREAREARRRRSSWRVKRIYVPERRRPEEADVAPTSARGELVMQGAW